MRFLSELQKTEKTQSKAQEKSRARRKRYGNATAFLQIGMV